MRGRARTSRATPSVRSEVKRTWKEVRVLSGFMKDDQFRQYARDHMSAITEQAQVLLLNRAKDTRDEYSKLAPVRLDGAVLRRATSPYLEAIRGDSLFLNAFRDRATEFAWIDPTKVVALQVDISLPVENLPEDEA